jgi:hypothetical protein
MKSPLRCANRAILYARPGESTARTLATAPGRYVAASTGQVVGCWWTRSRWLWAGRLVEVLGELPSSCSGELRSEWRHLRAGVSDARGTSSCTSPALVVPPLCGIALPPKTREVREHPLRVLSRWLYPAACFAWPLSRTGRSRHAASGGSYFRLWPYN